MNISEHLRSAIQSLVSSKLRSALTILGIIIGVWAIVSMQSIVAGFDQSMHQIMARFGTETFFIQKMPAFVMGHEWREYQKRQDFKLDDAYYLDRKVSNVRSAAATAYLWGRVIKYHDKKTSPNVMAIGTTAGYFYAAASSLYSGRFFTADEVHHRRAVAIIGLDVADELFPNMNPLGSQVKIDNNLVTVIGVLAPQPGFSLDSPDNVIILPLTYTLQIYPWAESEVELMVRASTSEVLPSVMDETIAMLRVRRHVQPGEENDFEVFTGDSILRTMNNFTFYLRVAAIGIAAISLLVAGIGIMNIMLVSVLERTREIGTRKALGARNRHILFQFLIEAVILSEFGAIIGIGVGFLTAFLIDSQVPNMTAVVPLKAIFGALVYCSFIGIVFGSFPANKASKMNPIDALHYE